jgi:hypothetical protein
MKELSFSAFWAIGSELLGVGLPIIAAIALIIAVATVVTLVRFGASLSARDWFKAALIGAASGIAGLLVTIFATNATVTDLRVSTDYLAAVALVFAVGIGITAVAGAFFGARRSRISMTS